MTFLKSSICILKYLAGTTEPLVLMTGHGLNTEVERGGCTLFSTGFLKAPFSVSLPALPREQVSEELNGSRCLPVLSK